MSPVQDSDAAGDQSKDDKPEGLAERESAGDRHCPEDSAGPSDLPSLSKVRPWSWTGRGRDGDLFTCTSSFCLCIGGYIDTHYMDVAAAQ